MKDEKHIHFRSIRHKPSYLAWNVKSSSYKVVEGKVRNRTRIPSAVYCCEVSSVEKFGQSQSFFNPN